ncbi:hypothetical protein Taro_014328 [Colocasia esculenta]|uniref:Uncharacterized protein n=1 Tax=Colocasia esculenta TaxID=4460 RepID=A0A843UHW8_COLES|nr:hypothetical protein [Colocasia esculenta]
MVGLGRRGRLGVLPGAGQPVLFLTPSLLVAPEPHGEARHGTIVQPDYGVAAGRALGGRDGVRLLSSGRVRVGQTRRGGSRGLRS